MIRTSFERARSVFSARLLLLYALPKHFGQEEEQAAPGVEMDFASAGGAQEPVNDYDARCHADFFFEFLQRLHLCDTGLV